MTNTGPPIFGGHVTGLVIGPYPLVCEQPPCAPPGTTFPSPAFIAACMASTDGAKAPVVPDLYETGVRSTASTFVIIRRAAARGRGFVAQTDLPGLDASMVRSASARSLRRYEHEHAHFRQRECLFRSRLEAEASTNA